MTEYRTTPHFNPWSAGGMGMSVDPFKHGIGIFDLSTMEWRDEYDPDAEPYVTPDAVKAMNGQSPYPSEWSDTSVQSWFVQKGT